MSATTTALTETIPSSIGAPHTTMTTTNPSYAASKTSLVGPGKDRPASLVKSNANANDGGLVVEHNIRTGSSQRVTRPTEGEEEGAAAASIVNAITPQMRRREKIVIAAMSFALFMAGWNDGTTGPLLPRIQRVYGVGFAVVSIIFISGCLGFILGALVNVYLTDRYNFGTLMIGAAVLQILAYSVQSAAPPFPLFCVMYALNGIGMAIQDAQANGLVASVHEHASEKMGLLHAIYGLGAFSAPLVATQFAQLQRWSFHFLASLGFAVINAVFLVLTVKNRSLEGMSIGSPPVSDAHAPPALEMDNRTNNNNGDAEQVVERTSSRSTPTGGAAASGTQKSSMSQILGNMTVQLMAIFILVYVGVEVTIGGWIVTFIIEVRGGGPSSGYVSSGFFGGLTLGRVALLWVNKKVGERRVVFIYALLAIGLELVIWLVPSLIGNAVAVSIVGWIAGFGQAGSAVIPFMTGALASRFGIKSLQPLLVAMMAFMSVLWALVPNHSKRRD
ncbi:hypothetical protein FRC17_003459 [Serendipita sp. 399]|nr:hypothetical protein FRC17_003459 [Serendipita sp. 399]